VKTKRSAWVLCIKDERPHGWEIAIARRSFKHGFRSYGWFDPNEKRYISGDCHNNHAEMPPKIFSKLKAVAVAYAKMLNDAEQNAPRP